MPNEFGFFDHEDAQEMIAVFKQATAFLGVISRENMRSAFEPKEIKDIVNRGLAPYIFNTGDQLDIKWTDKATGTEYDSPMDIVSFHDKTLKDGTVMPGMQVMSHWATPITIEYNPRQAFFAATEAKPAGKYYFNIPTKTGETAAGDYTFELPVDLPAGGQLMLGSGWYASAWTSLTITMYASPTEKTALGTCTLTKGSEGTYLGSMDGTRSNGLNMIGRSAYGSNDPRECAQIQWLNSDELNWWEPKSIWDRPPANNGVKYGYLSGFDEEFRSILEPTKYGTAFATCDVVNSVTAYEAYDIFRMPSLEEIYCTPQLKDVEGPYFDYWKRALGRTTPAGTGSSNKYPAYLIHSMSNHNSAVYVRLRSVHRSNTNYAWILSTTGYASNYAATNAYATAPVCDI